MDERQLLDLLNKFQSGNCTAEELSLLNEWFQQPEPDQQDWLFPETLKAGMTVEMYQEFLNKLQNRKTAGHTYKKIRQIRYAAIAAAVLLFIGVGLYIYLNRKPEIQVAGSNILHDVPPGSTGAILTLADGSKVVLDSTGTMPIAKQGNTQIINGKGQLAYNAGSSITSQVTYNTLSTPRGRQYKLILPDGTKVWLNAESSVHYPTAFVGNERTVEVTGEAYFEVIHNAAQPFKVNVKEQIIEDIGTHFNINAYDDEPGIRTTLLEGGIVIHSGTGNAVLKPGQQAFVKNGEKNIAIKPANLSTAIAWKRGLFRFEQTDLKTIMRQIARWYDLTIVYEGNVSDDVFQGQISQNQKLSDILKILQTSDIHFTINTENGRKELIIKP